MTPRHKVFVSFHHAKDEAYREKFCKSLGRNHIVDKSVEDGDIDPGLKTDTIRGRIRDEFITDATVTVVLVGRCTWQRNHVDWEIGSSLRATTNNPRCGLLGIWLPTHPDYRRNTYRPRLLPPRLADNYGNENPFARMYKWPNPWSTAKVRGWIHAAFERRRTVNPNNARTQFRNNRSGPCGTGWSE